MPARPARRNWRFGEPERRGNDSVPLRCSPSPPTTTSHVVRDGFPLANPQQKLLAIRRFLLASTEVPVSTYEAPPTDSCRGVIHGVPAGTSPHELLSHLISTEAPIIKVRMMGSTETALITFEGSLVPRYVLYYHQVKYRCQQNARKLNSANAMPDLLPRPYQAPAGQEHDCYATCRNCKCSHPSTWTECPEKLKAEADPTSLPPPTGYPQNRQLIISCFASTGQPPFQIPVSSSPFKHHGHNPPSMTKFEAQTRPDLPNAKTQRTHQQHRPRDIEP
ncbi:hypothetical protein HPB48_005933 [Haemaphysalis longicornis]|uniref:Uncharacterized protein n=1 Tax=Haemaphysalis longicornis TaxID=44386 RepID=A0A9J6FB90_HAELO|nr:hypothetical protein HPB48_005933 [Haemaphysalis longicornis]